MHSLAEFSWSDNIMFQLLAHVAAAGETGLISEQADHTALPHPTAAGGSTEYLTGRNPTCLVGREREREGESG